LGLSDPNYCKFVEMIKNRTTYDTNIKLFSDIVNAYNLTYLSE